MADPFRALTLAPVSSCVPAVAFPPAPLSPSAIRFNAKAGVISFRLVRPAGRSFDDMQLFARTDREPGMFAIVKRLWQGTKTQHITVKGAAFFEVSYINGDMIKNRLL